MASTRPTLEPRAEIHLWHALLDRGRRPSADRLPAAERQRAAAIVRPPARRRWVAARWALRGVLGRYLDQDPEAVELRLGPHGKPALAAAGSLRFNLSHSGERVLIAVAREYEVGVDIQRMRRLRGRERPAAFYAAWTRREAIAKCHGTGLWSSPPDIAVAVCGLDSEPGYAAALAVAGDEMPPLRQYEAAPGRHRASA